MLIQRALTFSLLLGLTIGCSSLRRPGLQLGQGSTPHQPLSAPRVQQGPFTLNWPVDRARLTQKFKPNQRGRRHLGIDLASQRGTPLLAAHTGRVVYTGSDFSGFGRMVLIESDQEWATLYAHLDKIYVSEGQKVVLGDVIGEMGDTGRATGVHLHFELRRNKEPVDPMVYLPQIKTMAAN